MANEHRSYNRANQGLNTKLYMVSIIVALLLIIATIFFFVVGRGTKSVPKAIQPQPNSQLMLPSATAGTRV